MKKFLTSGGGCRRVRLDSTTDLWLLNIPGIFLFLFSLFVILGGSFDERNKGAMYIVLNLLEPELFFKI